MAARVVAYDGVAQAQPQDPGQVVTRLPVQGNGTSGLQGLVREYPGNPHQQRAARSMPSAATLVIRDISAASITYGGMK